MKEKKLHVYSLEEMVSIISDFKEITGCKNVEIVPLNKNYSILYIDGEQKIKTHKTACYDFLKLTTYVIETYYKNK